MMNKIDNRMPEILRLSAAFILLCAITGMQPAHAQETHTKSIPSTNEIPGKPAATATNEIANGNKAGGPNKTTFNFVDADIESVIVAFGDYTKTTFIIDPRVKGKINLVYDKPLSKAQAFQLLTSVLRMQSYAMVPGNGYIKVVPEADAKLQSVPTQVDTVRGDQIATQIFHLNYESANNLVAVLRPLITPNNTINADAGNNTLIITDYADNLLRLGKIIATLDAPATNDLDVVPIRYAVANDIAAMVNRLMEPSAATGGDAGRVALFVYPRTNSVVVRAPSEARANLAKTLIAKLDQPTAQPGNVHVVYLKNAEAIKLAQTLRAVVSADTSATNTASSSLSSASSSSPAAPAPAQASLSSGGTAGFIQADPATNTLIITASELAYRDLRTVIDQLDARRAQVYIESLIVEVDATKAAEFGVQWGALGGGAANRSGGGTSFSTGGNNLASQAAAHLAPGGVPLVPGNGLNLGIFSSKLGFGALIHALETDTSSNILSMPNLITLDNEEAKIVVGQNVPFITGQYTTAASAGSAGVNPFQTVERKDIGLTLRVRPQISQGGTVRMAIYQETSGIDNSVTTGGAGLATTKRSIDTNVLVDDGQIIVLGGLIDDNLQDSVEKVPGLSAIPIIGNLFQYKTRAHVKKNLMVFLRPTIIFSNEQNMSLAGDRYDYIRNAEIVGQSERTGVLPNMDAPLLPPLKDGRMVGGLLVKQAEPHTTALPPNPAPQQPAAVPQ